MTSAEKKLLECPWLSVHRRHRTASQGGTTTYWTEPRDGIGLRRSRHESRAGLPVHAARRGLCSKWRTVRRVPHPSRRRHHAPCWRTKGPACHGHGPGPAHPSTPREPERGAVTSDGGRRRPRDARHHEALPGRVVAKPSTSTFAWQVHALLGENGAGKTTLMNILYGLAVPDEGEILSTASASHRRTVGRDPRGIGMVHQHFMLVPVLSVADNILLGGAHGGADLPRPQGRALGDRRARSAVRLRDRPEAKVGSLSVGWQQRVEILKALYRKRASSSRRADCGPTPQETEEIFEVLRRLRPRATHRLHQPQAQRGSRDRRSDHRHQARKVVGPRPEETDEELAELMVGRDVSLTVDRGDRTGRHRPRCQRT